MELLAYPELALTPYFPKRIRDDFDQFFETDAVARRGPAVRPGAEARMAFHLGYAEKDGGRYYNTALLVDEDGTIFEKYRKTHLPGVTKPDGVARVFEPYYFAYGDTGFKVFDAKKAKVGIAICQDRRYPESYRVLGLQGAEIVVNGYNTPPIRSPSTTTSCAPRGRLREQPLRDRRSQGRLEDGVELIGGSCIVNPLGEVVAKASTTGDW